MMLFGLILQLTISELRFSKFLKINSRWSLDSCAGRATGKRSEAEAKEAKQLTKQSEIQSKAKYGMKQSIKRSEMKL